MSAINLKQKTQENKKTIVVAGGCFWCMEKPYHLLNGVISTISGYAGGAESSATYPQVSSGKTNHMEVLKIDYDANLVSFKKLLDLFWLNIDPLDYGGQFCDRGGQYRSAIFYQNEAEKQIAAQSKTEIAKKLKKEIATLIIKSVPFYAAESYHQNYYTKNPIRYKFYRFQCGRDQRLKQLWD